jgi:hypothetical protein
VLSGTIIVRLPLVGVSPLRLPATSALSELISISAVEIPPIARLGIEHLTFWRVAPLPCMVLFNQQYRLEVEE